MLKNLRPFHYLILLILPLNLSAQNGKLLEEQIVDYSDAPFDKLKSKDWFDPIEKSTNLFSITYESDGLKITGYMAKPNKPGTYPVVIFNRGGNRDFGSLKEIMATYILGRIASWGYVVVASNYRGGGGSEGMEEFGGKDVNDILNLIPMLANIEEADTSRMGIYGYSRGGLMTYRTIAETCAFKAAIVGAGVANASRNIEERPDMEEYVYAQLIPDFENSKEEALKDRSPILWTDKFCETTPIMLLHGSADWRVSPEDALDMAAQLYKNKHPFRFHFYEGGDHGLTEYRDNTWHEIRAFFDHYVRDLNPLPNMVPHGK